MDAFRRFRARRKSKGQADIFTTFNDAESSYRPTTHSHQGSASRPITADPRPSDIGTIPKVSHDQFRQPKSSTEQGLPGSRGKPQQFFVGISRPFSDLRPGTAESMQKALDKAAESVKHPNQSRGPASPGSHTGKKAPR